MKAIIVDDEQIALDNLELTLKEFPEITEITTFRYPVRAVEWLKESYVDVAFLDINMKQMDGLALAKSVKELHPECAIIFVTGYSQYALDALRLHVSGYLMKPVRVERLREELDYVLEKHPLLTDNKKLFVQCFGNFEIFLDKRPMRFQYKKTKELLAYLIDRKGAFCTNGEIMGILWEEEADRVKRYSYFRDLRADLFHAFEDAGCPDAVQKQRGMLAVVPEKFCCDYYEWLKGNIDAVNRYRGEYMAQYSWGELTLSSIKMSE